MSLLYIDGFDHFTTISDKYTTNGTVTSEGTIVRNGTGKSLKIGSAYTNYAALNLTAFSLSEFYFGVACYCTDFYSRPFLSLSTSGIISMSLTLDVNSVLTMSSSNYNYEYKVRTFLTKQKWFYVEGYIKVSSNTAAGDILCKINNEQVLSCEAGLDIADYPTVDSLILRATSYYLYYDDLYVSDSGFLGPVKVKTLLPNGNGNSNQFTGSDGNSTDNYLLVDDSAQHDGDSTYVQSSTDEQVDLYTFEDVGTVADILGVSVDIIHKKDDSGTRTGKPLCRSGTTNYAGTTFTPTTSYAYASNIWETDPDTSTAWDETSLNAAEFGIKVES